MVTFMSCEPVSLSLNTCDEGCLTFIGVALELPFTNVGVGLEILGAGDD